MHRLPKSRRLQLQRLRAQAKRGDLEAALQLATLWQILGDDQQAEQWFRVAARDGDVCALNELGVLLARTDRRAEALSLWLNAAEAGDPTAALNAAKVLDHTGDDVQAERWYRFVLASDGEDADEWEPEACALLAQLLQRNGRDGEATPLWVIAAERGDPIAAYNAAQLLEAEGDDAQAERWYRFAADNDDPDARDELARLLYRTDRQAQALPLIISGAAEGSVECALYLAAHLLLTSGDRDEAERWLRVAADSGRVDALRELGTLMYESGRTSEAVDAWVTAARQGDATAAYNAALWYDGINERGTALGWYRRAAELGDRTAARELRRRTGASQRDRSRPAQRRSRKGPNHGR